MKTRSQQVAGWKANAVGAAHETPVQFSLDWYKAQRLAVGEKSHPKFIKIRGVWTPAGKGAPDFRVTIAALNGMTCWLEVKTWQAKNRNFYPFTKTVRGVTSARQGRINQFEKLQTEFSFGALAFYLACWRWQGREDWRLHPAVRLQHNETGITFERTEGLEVDSSNNWPDWLPAAIAYYRTLT